MDVNKDTGMAYIYLIQDGYDIGTNIYKIGRTFQDGDSRSLKRLKNYSKGTIIHNLWRVDEEVVIEIERKIKNILKPQLFRGSEWFEGDVCEIKKQIDTIIDSYKTICDECQNSCTSYWCEGLYGPCKTCVWPKILNCSCKQSGCKNCYPHYRRLFYDEDEPKSYCGTKNCYVYGCYKSDNGKCLSSIYNNKTVCDECNSATGYWDENDKWQYCKKCTNFDCDFCGGSRYVKPGVVDDSCLERLCIYCAQYRYMKLKS